jgi:hypothetical protein
MSKLHVIGVGGTGHKVLSAVVHLAACGAFKGKLGSSEINEISVLTIDADDANGNLTQTKTVLSSYRSFREALGGGDALGLVSIEPVHEKINLPLYKENKKSLSRAFNIPQYSGSDDDAFIRFLYSDDEIEVEFDQGFYGHTSIGTLMVKDILKESDVWKDLINKINDDDFVFVTGSIFGGTGASSIPVLLEELSSHKRKAVNFKLAALLLNPYFKTAGEIKEDGLLKPDSENFNIKAKTSLYYYYMQNQYKKTDALYIIGESEQNFSFEAASRGSANQRNKAHPIELFAAAALIDFIRESPDRDDNKIIAAYRAKKDADYCYTWDMIAKILPELPKRIQNTVKAAIFYNKVVYSDIAHGTAAAGWQKYYDEGEDGLDKKRDSKQQLYYENVRKYCSLLTSWVYDIHKCNKKEINQNTGDLEWEPDSRVKLFDAKHSNIFDNSSVEGAEIENFEKLVFDTESGIKSIKVYSSLANEAPKDKNDKGFNGLFKQLLNFVSKPQKGFLGFGKKPDAPEKFDSVPYLSKENGITFAIPNNPSRLWAKAEPNVLMSIAEGLPSSVSENFTKNDISIPSPWSIFIANELTLTEQKFAGINRAAFREWCGIIALLVLRKICRYDGQGLKLERLGLGGGDGDFLRVVKDTLPPESHVFDNPDWIKALRVTLDGVTIAFLANNTLVCPVYALDVITKGKLNKMAPTIVDEDGNFQHPEDYFKDQSQSLNRDAKYALKLFLAELKELITREAKRGNKGSIIKNLQELTDAYISALGSVTSNSNIAIDPIKKDSVHSVADLFEELCLEPARLSEDDLPFIMEGAKIQAALTGLNICGISSQSAAASHYLVTPSLLYNQIDGMFINDLPRNNLRDGIRLFYADDLLLDSMIVIKKEGGKVFNALPNDSSLSNWEILWPLSVELLELYTPSALNKMVSLSSDSEKITVNLKIKLRGKLGSHTVSKEYRIKNRSDMSDSDTQLNGKCCIMEKNTVPFWSLWPYAKINNPQGENTWRRYNCFCVEPKHRGVPVLEIKPVFDGNNNNLAGERSLSTLNAVTHEFKYRRYTDLPWAFIMNEKTDKVPIYRGLIFLDEAKSFPAGTSAWNVGIDFGTTSTTAFYTSDGNTKPQFIQLMDEYKWKEGSTEPQTAEQDSGVAILSNDGSNHHEYYFIDKQCLAQNGYATTLEIMDISAASSEAVIFDTHRVFWHNHENFKKLNTEKGRKERLLTNIKWESEKSNSAKYLNQLMTQIVYHAAERGVRKINFFFSYPTAFGPKAQKQFCARVEEIIKNLSADTGIDLIFVERRNLVTESIAAAYYFAAQSEREKLFLCVDIGGGSTDTSIWVEEKNIFQTSVHFASRDMFIRVLSRLIKRESVLKAITTDSVSDGIYTMLSDMSSGVVMTDEKFKFFIETVLFEFEKPLKTRLDDLKGQDKKAFNNFEYSVLIAYTGLIYYLANIIASLFIIKDEKRKIDSSITKLVLGLSGKGSKLTAWLAYCDIIYAEAEKLIKEKTSEKIEIKIEQKFAPETAKTETAQGMICNLSPDGTQKNKTEPCEPDLYMGCGITADNGKEKKELAESAFIDVYNDQFFAEPAQLKVEFDKELKELDAFIAFFNKIAAKTHNDVLPIDSRAISGPAKKDLWNKIDKESKNTLKEGRFEPPFILMLKVFLEEYAEEYLWKKLD